MTPACPDFAARLFAQTPLAISLPQDSPRELNVRAMRKSQLGRKCFGPFEFSDTARTAHQQRTLPNLA
jgi:hypothetical protein